MAGGINSVLSQAKSALAAAQVAMNTTAKNVSNVNTDGYSRQRVELVAGAPEEYGRLRIGGGVDVGSVTRSTNEFVNRRLVDEQSSLGRYQGLSDIYAQLEMVFKDEGEGSVSGTVSQFFNNLRTLSSQPDSVPLRTAVRESAKGVTSRFRTMSDSIDQVVNDIDRRVEGGIAEVNRLTERIASLNAQITSIEVRGAAVSANDERDQRDMAVNALSKLMDIKTTKLENGGINVTVGNLGPLVMGTDRQELGAFRAPNEDGAPDSMRVFLMSPHNATPPKDVTDRFSSGEVGGLLHLRENVIPEFRDQVDSMAYNLSSEVNAIHRDAFTRNGQKGVTFFAEPMSVRGASAGMQLSDEVEQDVGNIATAELQNAAGDNRALLKMTELETAKIFNGGRSSFSDMASNITGSLGVQVRAANDGLETQRGVVEQLDTLRKTASGVSLDEEAMNMLKFQKAFDASAKMIQVADQMMDTVINLKRF